MNEDRTEEYIQLMADHMAQFLPRDRAEAEKCIRLIQAKIGRRRPSWSWRIVPIAAGVLLAFLVGLQIDPDDLSASQTPYSEARIVERDGKTVLVIVRVTPGSATRVLHREVLTGTGATEWLAKPNWQALALEEYATLPR